MIRTPSFSSDCLGRGVWSLLAAHSQQATAHQRSHSSGRKEFSRSGRSFDVNSTATSHLLALLFWDMRCGYYWHGNCTGRRCMRPSAVPLPTVGKESERQPEREMKERKTDRKRERSDRKVGKKKKSEKKEIARFAFFLGSM